MNLKPLIKANYKQINKIYLPNSLYNKLCEYWGKLKKLIQAGKFLKVSNHFLKK